ncbi:MAG: hypothetical protein IRZ03_18715 [Acidobacterium ailaaui]|nr:hypothetical protein [Pseudacidobacterium ailaaui]
METVYCITKNEKGCSLSFEGDHDGFLESVAAYIFSVLEKLKDLNRTEICLECKYKIVLEKDDLSTRYFNLVGPGGIVYARIKQKNENVLIYY